MLVATDVRVSLIESSSGRGAANARSKDGALHSQQSSRLCSNRKVKGIISCFILLELKSSLFTPTAILISVTAIEHGTNLHFRRRRL